MSIARRPTTVFVSRAALEHNVRTVKDRASGRPIMAIVKANAYGHGLLEAARTFLDCGVERLGVAFLEEGIALRNAGIKAPILVLGGIIGNQVDHFLQYNLDLTAASPHKLEQIESAAKRQRKRAQVHLLFDTGMERLGIHWHNALDLVRAATAARAWVEVVGLFSHFACADEPQSDFTATQLARFKEVLDIAAGYGLSNVPVHLANSGALFGPHSEATAFDWVRPGLALYGIGPFGPEPALRPALTLETRIVYFKVVEPGAGVSYGSTWRAPQSTRVVTLPVGYGDGYPFNLVEQAYVVLRGSQYPIVGRVTMDALMVDLGPNGTGYNGDRVFLIGGDEEAKVTVHDLARWTGSIPYQVLTSINTRVPRIYRD